MDDVRSEKDMVYSIRKSFNLETASNSITLASLKGLASLVLQELSSLQVGKTTDAQRSQWHAQHQ